MTYLKKIMNVFSILAFYSFLQNTHAIELLNHSQENARSYLWNISSSDSDSDRKSYGHSKYKKKNKRNESFSSDEESFQSKKKNKRDDSSSSGEESSNNDRDYEEDNRTPFSQQDEYPNRGEFNEARIDISKVNSFINVFKRNPNVSNLSLLLKEIANEANIAYNNEKTGTVRGTHKHTFCKEFMDHIKTQNKNTEFDNVRAEYATHDEKSRFDVVWFDKENKNKSPYVDKKYRNAYVFDYKFGDDSKNKSNNLDNEQYEKSLNNMKYTLKGGIRDIHPSNNSF